VDETSPCGWDLAVGSSVVRASGCHCQRPGFDASILRHSRIWGAADEAVLSTVLGQQKRIKGAPVWNFRSLGFQSGIRLFWGSLARIQQIQILEDYCLWKGGGAKDRNIKFNHFIFSLPVCSSCLFIIIFYITKNLLPQIWYTVIKSDHYFQLTPLFFYVPGHFQAMWGSADWFYYLVCWKTIPNHVGLDCLQLTMVNGPIKSWKNKFIRLPTAV